MSEGTEKASRWLPSDAFAVISELLALLVGQARLQDCALALDSCLLASERHGEFDTSTWSPPGPPVCPGVALRLSGQRANAEKELCELFTHADTGLTAGPAS